MKIHRGNFHSCCNLCRTSCHILCSGSNFQFSFSVDCLTNGW